MVVKVEENARRLNSKQGGADGKLVADLLAKIDLLLENKDLQKAARALLLLNTLERIIQVPDAAPEIVDRYWDQLKRVNSSLPDGRRDDYFKLKAIQEPGKEKADKGFAPEALARIAAAEQQISSDPEQARAGLLEVEADLKNRSWPMGKGPIQVALVMAWARLDRACAMERVSEVSKGDQAELVRDLNKVLLITSEEWGRLSGVLGEKRVVEMVWEKIAPEKTICAFPEALLEGVSLLMAKWEKRNPPISEAVARLAWLLVCSLMVPPRNARLYEEHFGILVNLRLEPVHWPSKFSLIRELLMIGLQTGFLNDERMESLIEQVPPHLNAYAQAQYLALIAEPATAERLHLDLKRKTQDDPLAMAWFLVWLVVRGLAPEALRVAEQTGRHSELSKRVRRAWLSHDPERARSSLHSDDLAGDPVGEFLCQPTLADRVAFLRRATNGGTRSLPGPMWVNPPVDETKKGLFGIKVTPKRTFEEQAQEFLARTPLYGYVPLTVKEPDHFAEFLRVVGFGEYTYQVLDHPLLEALIAWAEEDPQAVRSVTTMMWEEIQPEDFVLFIDLVKNHLLERCEVVLAADTQVLVDGCAAWLQQEWVRKGRKTKLKGNDIQVKLPVDQPFRLTVAAAGAAARYSKARCDDILVHALEQLDAGPELVTLAARTYSVDKAPFELAPPLELKGKELAAWQLGVVQSSFANLAPQAAAVPESGAPHMAAEPGGILGVLFDIHKLQLQSSLYGQAAYRALFEAIDTRQLAGCSLLDGDTRATLGGSANHYCIAIDSISPDQAAAIKKALEESHEPALLPVDSRFLDAAQAGREPLVRAAEINAQGELVNCTTFWVIQAWKAAQEKRRS